MSLQLKLSKLDANAYNSVLDRIENCLVNARSERAKRKLFDTALDVAYYGFAYDQWRINREEYLNKRKKEWSWKSLTGWKLWKTKEKTQ